MTRGTTASPEMTRLAKRTERVLARAHRSRSRSDEVLSRARAVRSRAGAAVSRAQSQAVKSQLELAIRRAAVMRQLWYMSRPLTPRGAKPVSAKQDQAGALAEMTELPPRHATRRRELTTSTRPDGPQVRRYEEPGSSCPGPPVLTSAELRLAPLLATHLSFPEIGAQLFLSQNTVKSQAVSIYRKLGACSRTQAVTRLRELALLEKARATSVPGQTADT